MIFPGWVSDHEAYFAQSQQRSQPPTPFPSFPSQDTAFATSGQGTPNYTSPVKERLAGLEDRVDQSDYRANLSEIWATQTAVRVDVLEVDVVHITDCVTGLEILMNEMSLANVAQEKLRAAAQLRDEAKMVAVQATVEATGANFSAIRAMQTEVVDMGSRVGKLEGASKEKAKAKRKTEGETRDHD